MCKFCKSSRLSADLSFKCPYLCYRNEKDPTISRLLVMDPSTACAKRSTSNWKCCARRRKIQPWHGKTRAKPGTRLKFLQISPNCQLPLLTPTPFASDFSEAALTQGQQPRKVLPKQAAHQQISSLPASRQNTDHRIVSGQSCVTMCHPKMHAFIMRIS